MITEDQALETTRWDLEPLLDGRSVDSLLEEALERARAFSAERRGKVSQLDAAGLAAAMHELEAIADLAGRAGSYAALWFSLDTEDPERGALLQATR